MEQIKKDCRKRIYKSVGGLCSLFFVIALLLTIFYSGSIRSLLQGTKNFNDYEDKIVNKTNNDIFNALRNEYISADVSVIIGSYAEYGSKGQSNSDREHVYYIMPIQDGSYFVSIIVDKKNIAKFDELEQTFLKNIGTDNKTYPEGISVSGGFISLSEEEKAYALEFFEGYDENVQEVSQLSQILSPYAILVGEVGNTSIPLIWTLFFIIILLVIVTIIGCIVIYKDILLRPLLEHINSMSEEDKALLEEDYKNANLVNDIRFGKKFLYRKTTFAYEILAYENIIWMYKEQSSKERVITYQIKVYNKDGLSTTIYKNNEEAIVDRVVIELFDHCAHAVLGYQFSLHVTALDNPEKLYKKVKDLLSLEDEKIEVVPEKEEKVEETKEKKSKKKKIRKAIKSNETNEEKIPQGKEDIKDTKDIKSEKNKIEKAIKSDKIKEETVPQEKNK